MFKKYAVGLALALALPLGAMAAAVPTNEVDCVAAGGVWDVVALECTLPQDKGGHSSLTPCFFILKAGAAWCDNSNPELQAAWADPQIRDFFKALYLGSI